MSVDPIVGGLDSPDVELRPHGLGWRIIMEGRRVQITVTKLKRSSGGLRGYIEVDYARPKADGGGRLLLAGENLNMGDGRARASLANRLTERLDRINWRNVLDAVCIAVHHKDDEGEPLVMIGNLPPAIGGGWLVDGFLELRQNHSVFGDGDVGKSWVSLALAISIATGYEILPGYRPLYRGTPLLADYETDGETIDRRIKMIARGAGIDVPISIPYLRLDQPFADCLETVMTKCQEHDVIFLVVDSVEAAMAGSAEPGGASNEGPARMNQALRRLGRLGVTTLLIDHVNALAAGQKGLAGKAYGNIFKKNWVRIAYEMKRTRDKSADGFQHLGLFNQKRNNGQRFDPVGLRWEINEEMTSWTREEIADPELVEALPTPQKIHAYLRQNGPSQPSSIVEDLSLSRGNVSSVLSRRHDLFEKNGHGLWVARNIARQEDRYDDPDEEMEPLPID